MVHDPHRFPVRVYYEDTDAGGIVYHAGFLRFAERARTELLRDHGFDHPSLISRYKAQFALRRCTLDFLAPARLDDLLVIETRVIEVRGARMEFAQTVRRGDDRLVEIAVTLAFIDANYRPARIPREIIQQITRP